MILALVRRLMAQFGHPQTRDIMISGFQLFKELDYNDPLISYCRQPADAPGVAREATDLSVHYF